MNSENEQTTAFPRLYVCGQCLRIFGERAAYENHMNSMHMNQPRCAICEAGFLVLIDMIHHMLTHYEPSRPGG